MGFKTAVVPVTPLAQNCTLMWDEATRQAVVVDPGGDVPRILAAIAAQNLSVQAIWLTHGHLDHAGGAMDLREALRAAAGDSTMPIVGPDRRDAFLLANLRKQGEMFGMHGLRDVTPDRWLEEGATLAIGPHDFEVLHCPGHTPGHVVFLSRANGFAQVGDVLFQNSIGRTDFPYGDHTALIAAIQAKLLPLPDETRFICGHGAGSTIGAERASNPFLR